MALWAAPCALPWALASTCALASAAPPSRVLPPTVGALLEAAVARAGVGWSLRDATITAKVVRGTLVLRDGADAPPRAIAVVLSDPLPSCAAEVAGAWCVSLQPAVAAAPRRALLHALAVDPATSVWRDVSPAAAAGRLARASASARLGHEAATPDGRATRDGAEGGHGGDPGRSRWPALLGLFGLGALTVGLAWRWMATPAADGGPR